MFKYILKDYRYGIKNGLKNIKSGGDIYVWWFTIYLVICIYDIFDFRSDTLKNVIGIYVVLLLFWLEHAISVMYPNKISKMLNLCPLTMEEREKYLKQAYLLKVFFAITLYIILIPVFIHTKIFSPDVCLVSLTILSAYSVSVNTRLTGVSAENKKSNNRHDENLIEMTGRENTMPAQADVLSGIGFFAGIYGFLIICSLTNDITGKIQGTGKIITTICIVGFNLMLGIKMLVSYYRLLIQTALKEYNAL